MPLDHAILAILTGGPLHGHAIGKQLGRLLHGLRAVNPGQVYATLARLARDGSIAHGEGDVRTYALLPAGANALRRWLERPLGCVPRPEPFVQQLAVLVALGDTPGIARALDVQRRRCTALRALIERRAPAPGGGQDLLARAAQRHVDAEIAWLEEAAAALLAPAPAGGAAHTGERDDMDPARD